MIEVAAAIIEDTDGRILIARRREGKSQAGLWEFPGGKIEAGESPEDCLRRELLEEMNIEIEPYAFFAVNEHAYDTVTIRLVAYKANMRGGTIELSDHDEYRWIQVGEMAGYSFAPADIPFVEQLSAH
ncbi:(deoxy)nucleoside triphosphate pyrophosphohydrolase [Paenibacillus urinalis]|uniref:8-oxo-dGTP diphosphatase n=1 Tax=Paenibacillus urinalis TaxID=521520 RepID=A0ABY7XEZ5_9BACL|nr:MULTISPECIES: (deoxy)nucleoside triphosphate pyrophosphohydrolase [Paenibacillus]WDH99499.1 (deoxy)nucleoside triphosphate pyrophosphohydrolase [Paenibacillus urinalis]WDI03132.1 (deoxy)nucleoside triphosphate pyrophosphohydrolase [Paenibacillus urinalis]GAK41836.1 NUDIX hydrolase [Paenibacillus sp. TCA20]